MPPEHHLTFGAFRLDRTQGRLWRGDQVIPLRPAPWWGARATSRPWRRGTSRRPTAPTSSSSSGRVLMRINTPGSPTVTRCTTHQDDPV